jgi:hypothetical protein
MERSKPKSRSVFFISKTGAKAERLERLGPPLWIFDG